MRLTLAATAVAVWLMPPAAPVAVVHLTWVKEAGSRGEVQRTGSDCVIVTDNSEVTFAEFGALFRRCLE